MPDPVLDLVTARRWAVTCRLVLAGARQRIDELNVFPVPDGDTGTNMYRTIDGALDYVRGQFELGAGTERLQEGLALIARGMLLSARGNSGVILSQLARGLAEAVGPDVDAAGPEQLAAAFETAARTAWDALATPVEGTILTVARAAAQGAREAVDAGAGDAGEVLHVGHVVSRALVAAREALARTPQQLPQLGAAGVVDAGGAGLVLVVEALQAVLAERAQVAVTELPDWWQVEPDPAAWCPQAAGQDPDGNDQVEVMFAVTDSDTGRATRLRAHLDALGDSVVVAGGPDDFTVHVHCADPRAAVEAGTLAGSVADVRLTSLRDGSTFEPQLAGGLPLPGATGTALAVVACALGEGVSALFAGAGAQVVPSGPRHRASAGQILAAVRAGAGARVVVLPNDTDTVMVARAAAAEARREGIAVDVVPTATLVQGLAALSVLDLDGDPDATLAAAAEASATVRHGALSVADRAADTAAGPCAAGQWLGIVDRGIVAVHDDPGPVLRAVLRRLRHQRAEMVTVLMGEGADLISRQVQEVLDEVRADAPALEVVVLDGGQPTYPVLLGLE